MLRSSTVVVWTCGVVLFATNVVHANAAPAAAPRDCLAPVRAALTGYDLRPQGTLRALGQLASCLNEQPADAQAQEARFVRAAVANDVLFVASFTRNDVLRQRLARVLGVAKSELRTFITAELTACAHGVYAAEAEAALEHLDADVADLPALTGRQDIRADALRLRLAAQAASSPAVGGVFATLGVDPCAQPAQCDALYQGVDPTGRRALAFMQELVATQARVDEAVRLGDPLARALSDALASDSARLRGLRLRLPPALHGGTDVAYGNVTWPVPPRVVVVDEQALRLAELPGVCWSERGLERTDDAAHAYPKGESLAALHTVDLAQSSTRPFDALVHALAVEGPETSRAIAIALYPNVPAQVLSRVLLSLRRADIGEVSLLARNKGGAALLPLRVTFVDPRTPAPSAALKLRVRIGGYSVNLGTGSLDIPRVRDDAGFHFDFDGLRAALGDASPESAAVSFMPELASEYLVATAFSVQPEGKPLDLVVQ